MSLRLYSTKPKHHVSLWGGLGIPGDEVPTTGDNGGSPLANDGISPPSEYRIETVTPPSAGTLTVYPDTSYLFGDAPDGIYPWTYRVWEDSVDRGTAIEYLVVGSPVVVFAVIPALPTFGGSLTVAPTNTEIVFNIITPLPAFSGGVVSVDGLVVWSNFTLPPSSFSGSISSGATVSFNKVLNLPAFSGSIRILEPGALSETDVQRIAVAVHLIFQGDPNYLTLAKFLALKD